MVTVETTEHLPNGTSPYKTAKKVKIIKPKSYSSKTLFSDSGQIGQLVANPALAPTKNMDKNKDNVPVLKALMADKLVQIFSTPQNPIYKWKLVTVQVPILKHPKFVLWICPGQVGPLGQFVQLIVDLL